VLAALALAAIILPVAMRCVALSLAAAGEARHRVEAANLAGSKLAELIATGEWQSSDLSGDCGPEWPAYRWEAEVAEWPEDPALSQVSVSVWYSSRGTARAVSLTTLVYPEGE
jgi:hypothetical protein